MNFTIQARLIVALAKIVCNRISARHGLDSPTGHSYSDQFSNADWSKWLAHFRRLIPELSEREASAN